MDRKEDQPAPFCSLQRLGYRQAVWELSALLDDAQLDSLTEQTRLIVESVRSGDRLCILGTGEPRAE